MNKQYRMYPHAYHTRRDQKHVPHSEIGIMKTQLNTTWNVWAHWRRKKLRNFRVGRKWARRRPEKPGCLSGGGRKARRAPARRVQLLHVRTEFVQVVPCTRTMLRRDRVAVTVANDDVPKRMVHAQKNARLYSSVPLEGRRLWNPRRARTMLLNVLVFFLGGTWAGCFWRDPTNHRGDLMTRHLPKPG